MSQAAIFILAISVATTAGCAASYSKDVNDTSGLGSEQSAKTQPPVLTFEVVAISSDGTVGDATGEVQVLDEKGMWHRVHRGEHLQHDDRLFIAARSKVVLHLSNSSTVVLASPVKNRWLVLEVARATSDNI